MNLVAHEYVDSQDLKNPGVLILPRFAGAAEIFEDAILVNPFDTDETAEALRMALDMPLEGRIARWTAPMEAARTYSVENWSHSFLERLAPASTGQGSATRDMLYLASVA
ncbi:MAG: trehalose-6-phosphate synthase [Candidatus Devosia euplotis]|nr:trehalose-6-phosphate synthase [Candidatus Devosia euplotis]